MNALGLMTMGPLLGLICFGSKRWALVGMFGGILYMSQGQVIDAFGLNIYPMRVLSLAAFVRVILRGEWSLREINGIDKLLLLTYTVRTVIFILNGNGSAVNAIGLFVDVTLVYAAFRGLVSSFEDLTWFLRALVVLLVPYVMALALEAVSATNPFAVIGGIVEHNFRGDRPRCLGSFGHATLLGTFGASFLPLFIALGLTKKGQAYSIVGICLSLAMVFFSNSGGPLTCAILGLVGWLFWFVRKRMFAARIGIVAGLIALAFFMKAPIWYLPAKISDLTGGDGWHRSYLMDVAFRHVDQWWLAGMSILETKNWFPYVVASGGADMVNYYLSLGVDGGLITTLLFCGLLFLCFSRLGRALQATRADRRHQEKDLWLWALGVVLAIHVFNWFGITYFDQYYAVFFMQLAMISTFSYQCILAPSKIVVRNARQPASRSAQIPVRSRGRTEARSGR